MMLYVFGNGNYHGFPINTLAQDKWVQWMYHFHFKYFQSTVFMPGPCFALPHARNQHAFSNDWHNIFFGFFYKFSSSAAQLEIHYILFTLLMKQPNKQFDLVRKGKSHKQQSYTKSYRDLRSTSFSWLQISSMRNVHARNWSLGITVAISCCLLYL